MRIMYFFLFSLVSLSVIGQNKPYKDYDVCISEQTYKGKVNHGKSYCTAWATIRESKQGKKDTIAWTSLGGLVFHGYEKDKFESLSERGKYIIDSLKEDGIFYMDQTYMTYEPVYMKPGRKIEVFWDISGSKVEVFKYLFWNSTKGNGYKLLSSNYVE